MHNKLRIHHLLCIPLFCGKGYSGEFNRNMSEKIEWLKQYSDKELILVCETDMICEKCPNLTEKGICKNDNDHAKKKDKQLCKWLGIQEGMKYTYEELQQIMRKNMNRSIFEVSCNRCEWYQKGLCSWEGWLENII